MLNVKNIIFRNLTDADFFNINKRSGAEMNGGGQSYIDFPVQSISVNDWHAFFNRADNVDESQVTQGPSWVFPVHSIGVPPEPTTQSIKVYQRRNSSVSITSQKLYSNKSNRVRSWHPDNGFPNPVDCNDRHQCPDGLMVYFVSTFEGEIWAGWYLNDGMTPPPFSGDTSDAKFEKMIARNDLVDGYANMISFKEGEVLLNTAKMESPFEVQGELGGADKVVESQKAFEESLEIEEEEQANELFSEDISKEGEAELIRQVVQTRKRNAKIVKQLKKLYNHECQVTGTEFTFAKKNGENYTEAHHLVPLGKGGSDSPENLVVLSPIIHRMLHHARVNPFDLNNLIHLEDGSVELEIIINGQSFTIKWHPKHADLFTN